MVETHGVGPVREELRSAADRDPDTCHELAHRLGRAATRHYGSVSAAYGVGDPACGAGYFHGVAEGAVVSSSEVRNVNDFCADIRDAAPPEHRRVDCAHGVGHGLLIVRGGDLHAALHDCDRLVSERDRDACHAGVFMEMQAAAAQPVGSSWSLDPDRPLHPCPTLAHAHRDQCLQRQTAYALYVLGDDFPAVFRLCDELSVGARSSCHRGVGRDAAQKSLTTGEAHREDRIVALCTVPADVTVQAACIGGAVAALVRFHRTSISATALCDAVGPVLRDGCTAHLKAAVLFPER